MSAPKAERVVIRFMLAKSQDEWIRNQINILADKLEQGKLTNQESEDIAMALRGIAAGASAKKIFGLAKTRGGQSKVRVHKWMAIDYWLRSSLKHKKVSASVAVDWCEKSADTVADIARRNRQVAESIIERWEQNYPLERYLDAVADARQQLLTGSKPCVSQGFKETITLVADWEEALSGPPEITMPRANK